MAIPQLTTEQLQAARSAASDARRARAELKDAVKKSEITFSEALDKALANESLSRVKVADLLRAVPRVGVTRSQEIMEQLGISPNRRVRGLGRHQLERLKNQFN